MLKVKPLSVADLRKATKAQTAEFFGVSLTALEAWIRKGAPVVQRGSRGVGWVLDLHEVARWYYGGRPENPGETDPELLSPAERKAWYEGEAKRLELQVKARNLIPVSDVEETVATAFAALAQDLRAIPDNLERRYGVSGEVALRVEEALFEAMEVLADRLSTLAPISREHTGKEE